MSEFACEVVRVTMEPHPNAELIEIARVGDFQSIVRKDLGLRTGDLAVYIPEGAVLPEWLLREMNLWDEEKNKGHLHGSAGNRVKAVRLRGVVSQGLIYPCRRSIYGDWCIERTEKTFEFGVVVGDDVSEVLGITKYEVPIPLHMHCKVIGAFLDVTHAYDFGNIKKTPKMFPDGHPVVMTEKIHGTLMCVCVVPERLANEKFYHGRVLLTSKGMGGRGLVLDHNDPTNLYAQAAIRHGLLDSMLSHAKEADDCNKPIMLFGEVFGKTQSGAGVQDLKYTGETLDYRAFDLCCGHRDDMIYSSWDALVNFTDEIGVKTPPLLYHGPFTRDTMLAHTDGKTLVGGGHIREGLVVRAQRASTDRDSPYGRMIAKSVSNAYLLRKNATEFN